MVQLFFDAYDALERQKRDNQWEWLDPLTVYRQVGKIEKQTQTSSRETKASKAARASRTGLFKRIWPLLTLLVWPYS